MKQLTIGFRSLSRHLATRFALALLFTASFSGLILGGTSQESQALAATNPHKSGLQVVNFVTWWSLDPEGYHPAILLKLKNNTGKDLTGQLMRFQGRYIDLHTSQVTVARDQEQRQFVPRQTMYVLLRGQDAFELPLSTTAWPMLECKVMARIGDVSDDDTQTLLITNIERIAMSDDDARLALERMHEFTQIAPSPITSEDHKQSTPGAHVQSPAPTDGGLTARPERLRAAKRNTAQANSSDSLLQTQVVPGLGDDLAGFGKAFGLAQSKDSAPQGWTFASYKPLHSNTLIYAGSKGKSGKVDILIVEQPADSLEKESRAIDSARALSGKFKDQPLRESTHSVRYLKNGRKEFLSGRTASYKFTFIAHKAEGKEYPVLLVLSRLPGEIEPFLSTTASHAPILHPLVPLF